MNNALRDLRYAPRSLGRRPSLAIVVAATLALGIGANTAMFSVVNAVLLRPLPYPNAERLVIVWGTDAELNDNEARVSYPDFRDWREGIRLLVALGPSQIPRLHEIVVDFQVLVFTAVLSLAAGILVGLAPAYHTASMEPAEGLRGGSERGAAPGHRRRASGSPLLPQGPVIVGVSTFPPHGERPSALALPKWEPV